MEYALLRSLRALGPGLILIGYVDLFAIFVLRDCAIFWPLDTARLIISAYVAGGIYSVIASFLHRNKFAFDGVEESLKKSLSGIDPTIMLRSWKEEIAPCFYWLIDNDKSLEQKSKGIYFNGFIVTTSFDAVWISLVAAVAGAAFAVFLDRGAWFLVTSSVALLVSYGVWRLSIIRHCSLGNEQVVVIKKRFSAEFMGCLNDRKPKIGKIK